MTYPNNIQTKMSYNCVKLIKHGNPSEALSFATINGIPQPKEDEIIVQVAASPIDPFDFATIRGMGHETGPSFVSPGCEGVGRITSVGKNVPEFSVGQRVSFFSYQPGAWSEYLALKAPFQYVYSVPDNLVDTSAGLINPLTMYGLFDHSKASPKDWIMQTAAGSVLGQMAIEFAKVKGLKMINVVRRKEQVEQLKARYGADIHVVVFDGSNEAEALAEINTITNNKGVNIVFEAVGSTTFDFSLKAIAEYGHVLSYGIMSGNYNLTMPFQLLISKSPKVEGFPVTSWMALQSPEDIKKIVDELIHLMVTKKVVPRVESVFPFEEHQQAIAKATAPGKMGRIFLAAHPDKVTK